MKQKVFVGCDHGGFALKATLLPRLKETFPQIEFSDLGCEGESPVDYPDYARKVGEKVGRGEGRGILICGSGTGMAIAANKMGGVRAANLWDVNVAQLARQHNNTNVMCLGGRIVPAETAFEICKTWLTTEFEGGRHAARVDIIHEMETK